MSYIHQYRHVMSGRKKDRDSSVLRRSDTEVLESACEESRRVLDYQLSVQEDIDDKALWSIRTAVLVLGLLFSAGSLGDISQFLTLPWYVHVLAGSGVSLLLLTVYFGIGSYTMTETYPGISHRQRIKSHQGSYDYEEWYADLLLNYQWSITGQKSWNERNGFYLFVTHVCLLGGTTSIVSAGAIALFLTYDSSNGIALVGGLLFPVAVVVVLLLRTK